MTEAAPLPWILLAAACVGAATVVTLLHVLAQLKNYRRPECQRLVVRILLMVPVYGISSVATVAEMSAAEFLDAFRELYEAFALYTFFGLLVASLGGERELMALMEQRPRVRHVFPLRLILREPVDMSDPHTFLMVRRGVFQYVVVKCVLATVVLGLRLGGLYHTGEFSVRAPYAYVIAVYNASISVAMYCLILFHMAAAADLRPFRPLAKLACIKMVLFFSYWQSLAVQLLAAAGALSSATSAWLPALLISLETPAFAVAHKNAFLWQEHVSASKRVPGGRLPLGMALRDAAGFRDILVDVRHLVRGTPFKAIRMLSLGEIDERALDDAETMFLLGAEQRRYRSGRYGESHGVVPTGSDRLLRTANDPTPRFADPGDASEAGTELLYRQARSLRFGDHRYAVIPDLVDAEGLAHRGSSSAVSVGEPDSP